MASLQAMKFRSSEVIPNHFDKHRHADITQIEETEAAILIQSWFRAERVRAYIRFLHQCAILIQRFYRGHVDRGIYRQKVQEKLKQLKEAYYASLCTKIQSRWRGYYTRKYIFNYAARKIYLQALLVTNKHVRKQLEEVQIKAEEERRKENAEKEEADLLYSTRKQHYLLSTEVSAGVYNSPSHKQRYIEKERALQAVSPLSQLERDARERSQMLSFLQTSTGIPSAEQDEILRGHSSPPLPPIPKHKPQGPFRDPHEVQKQRYKKLQPSLRVATNYEAVDTARTKLRAQDWTKQIIDAKFFPSTKDQEAYQHLLHTTSQYGSLAYGTKHFRDRIPSKDINNKAFQRVVEPIPFFDKFGQTYQS